MVIRQVEYFEKAGPENTKRCVEIVEQLVKKEGYMHVVVASTSGTTGIEFSCALAGAGVNLVVVGHSVNFKEANHNEFSDEIRKQIQESGGKVFLGTILTHSLETSLAKEHGGIYPTILITQTLRRIAQGIKVGCEIVMEACDAGLIPEGEEIVAVGGTKKGADTVSIIKSVPSKRFLQLKVLEILAKPRG